MKFVLGMVAGVNIGGAIYCWLSESRGTAFAHAATAGFVIFFTLGV